jgi:GT2 family glycosyltransferase
MPQVLIIIVTWNKRAEVLRLLASIEKMVCPSSACDVLVVDNASDDGTADAVSHAYPRVRLIRNSENLGGSGGFNTGLRWAFNQPKNAYSHLWLLDNDVIVHRRALSELVAALDRHPRIGIVGSTMLQMECPWKINEMGGFLTTTSGRFRLNTSVGEIRRFKNRPLDELVVLDGAVYDEFASARGMVFVDYVAAASLLVRTEHARRNGLFKDYFIHFDDVEWCLRMKRRGYRSAIIPASLIWHHGSSSHQVSPLMHYYNSRNLLNLIQSHGTHKNSVVRLKWWVWFKALCFAFSGRLIVSYYHRKAIADFEMQRLGRISDEQPTMRTKFFFRWPKIDDLRFSTK